jgi:transcriptional regulator with XRE-family HTH domain
MIEVQKESPSLDRMRLRVRQELDDRSMTIQALADGTGLSRVWLSNFLSGKVALSFADADLIADFLEISIAELISEKIPA